MAKLANPSVGGGMKKPAPIKVKQDMIDFIKTQGMTKALKRAGELKASGKGGEAEFLEGVKRMYGANRLAKATSLAKPAAKSADAARGAYANKAAGNYTAKSKSQPKPKTAAYKAGTKSAVSKAPAKKNNNIALKVTGGALAGAALIASRGKAVGLAKKLSPGLAKSGVGKALGMAAKNSPKNAANVMKKKIADTREAAATMALATSGRAAAKAKRPVSQSQYDAMKARAGAAKPKPKMKKKAVAGAGVGAMTLKGDTAKPKKK